MNGRVLDVALELTVQLGGCTLAMRDVLALRAGGIVTLDRAAGEPADVLVNGKRIGRGEIVAVDGRFGIRITELVDQT